MLSWSRKRRKGQQDDIDRELRSHLELEREEAEERGVPPQEAHYAARRSLGNLTLLQEDLRALSRSTRLDTFAQDLAFAFRMFRRAPGFTALVLITLTLGIGANTAVFSILHGVLLQPLPYKDSNGLGAHDSAIGSPIRLDGQFCTIAAVMPSGFEFLPPTAPVTMWTILPRPADPDDFSGAVFGRLRPHVSLTSAQAEISLLHHRLHKHDRWGARMEPVLYDLHEEFTWLTGRNLRLSLYVLFAAVTLVLLICCVNVANLLLGRGVSREREMAIRASLGSGRRRLLRQLLTESLLLSLLASASGGVLATAIVSYFRRARPIELPPGVTLQISAPVLVFAVLLSVVTCLLFGLIPAWRASRTDLQTVLKSGSRRSSSQDTRQQRFGKQLIIAEVALTAILVAAAGLLIQTVQRFSAAPLGFQPNGLVTTGITLPPTGYTAPERRRTFFEQLQSSLAALPGVTSLALSSSRPIDGGGVVNVIMVEGHPEPRIDHPADTFGRTVSANYFAVLGVPLEAGRFFDRRDSANSEPVVIINDALAREYLPGENAVGKHMKREPWFS